MQEEKIEMSPQSQKSGTFNLVSQMLRGEVPQEKDDNFETYKSHTEKNDFFVE